MVPETNLAYLRAKKKVEKLKEYYQHLIAYVLVNLFLILLMANIFGGGKVNFARWEIYSVAFFWGIGLFFHTLYILFTFHFKSNILKRWETKKIKEILEKDEF